MLDVLVDMACVGVGQFAHGLARCRYGRIADDKQWHKYGTHRCGGAEVFREDSACGVKD